MEIDPDRSITPSPVEDSHGNLSPTNRQSEHIPALPLKPMKSLAQLNEEHAQALLAKKQLDERVIRVRILYLYNPVNSTLILHDGYECNDLPSSGTDPARGPVYSSRGPHRRLCEACEAEGPALAEAGAGTGVSP